MHYVAKDSYQFRRKLKQRLKAEGNEIVTNCHGLKMIDADGKMRMTDVAIPTAMLKKNKRTARHRQDPEICAVQL